MKRVTITTAALLLLMMITTIATAHDVEAVIQNPTIPTDRFDALNAIVQEPYLTWTSTNTNIGYSKHRNLAANAWMDWSEDGCSVPSELIPYRTKFYYGCLRHDFMWRTMAVLDQATGRVWNERNRFVADQMFLTDHQSIAPSITAITRMVQRMQFARQRLTSTTWASEQGLDSGQTLPTRSATPSPMATTTT